MRELILHIGTQKTGTTTIQRFLGLNQELLKEQKFLMPKSLDIGNTHHRWITSIAVNAERKDGLLINFGYSSKQEQLKVIKTKLKNFKEECDKSELNSKWIITSEHLQSELQTKEAIFKLKCILKEFFGKVKIILYIRDPLATTISLWSTQLKYGSKLRSLPLPSHPSYEQVSNHKKTIQNWESVFFRENITVVKFQKKDFINNDLIEDFCYRSGIIYSEKFKLPKIANTSLSLLGMKSLGYINKYIPHFIKTDYKEKPLELNKSRANISQYVAYYTSKYPKYLPTEEELLNYRKYYKDSDEWVIENFFKGTKTLWDETFKELSSENKGILKLTESEQMILNLVIKLWKERSENNFQFKNGNISL